MHKKNIDKTAWSYRAKTDLKKNWDMYLIVLPVIIWYIVFAYFPMYGAIIAFKDYKLNLGVFASRWANPIFKHFKSFLFGPDFLRVFWNTLKISLFSIAFSFPAPIILALLINELRTKWFARITQTFTYLPHFISLVVICGMISSFTQRDGFINDIVVFFGGQRVTMLADPNYFLPVYIISEIWATMGWGSIIYLSALTSIDQQLYEAAEIDGAGRIRQTIHVTLPGILPTIIIMLILRIGGLMSVGYEKIILLSNDYNRNVAEVISSYVYRRGLAAGGGQFSYSTAVGLFNAVINCTLVVVANTLSRKFTETSLW